MTNPDQGSSEFKDFIKQCLTIDPEKRPEAKDLLKHEFMKKVRKVEVGEREGGSERVGHGLFGGNRTPPGDGNAQVQGTEQPANAGKQLNQRGLQQYGGQRRQLPAERHWHHHRVQEQKHQLVQLRYYDRTQTRSFTSFYLV